MADKIRLRRGTDAQRLTITPALGEPIWCTDTEKLYIGDGSTVGGLLVNTDHPTAANVAIADAGNLFAVDTVEAALQEVMGDLDTHEAASNPHSITAAGISAIPTSEKGAASGVATLDANTKIPASQLPAIAVTEVIVVADITARDALTIGTGDGEVQEGDVVIVTDGDGSGNPRSFIYNGASYSELVAAGQVTTVNGSSGVVVLTDADISYTGTKSNIQAGSTTVKAAIQDLDDAIDSHTHADYAPTSHTHTASQVTDFDSAAVSAAVTGLKNAVTDGWRALDANGDLTIDAGTIV